jgi:hypothetical protein
VFNQIDAQCALFVDKKDKERQLRLIGDQSLLSLTIMLPPTPYTPPVPQFNRHLS